jgi:serine/threonine protein kinase/tetratricopeptide (TPR) repeat protein
MGTVFLVEDKDHEDRPLALKRLRGDRVDKKTIAILRKEFLALATLEHPGLARVHDFGLDFHTGDYFFTGEFVDGVNLLQACKGFDLEKKEDVEAFADIFAQILRALEFIHSRGLVHGDIKPENILVTGISEEGSSATPRVKLIDFGLIKREKEFGGKRIIGTTYYIAPETITGSQVDRRTDLYSLGVVLYHIATGRLPFSGDSNIAILKGHMEKAPEPPSSVKPGLSEGLGGIILRLMEKRPADRFQRALEVLDALNGCFDLDIPLETKETCTSYLRCAQFINGEEERKALKGLFVSACGVEPVDAEKELSFPPFPGSKPSGGTGLSRGSQARHFVLLRGEKGLGKRKLITDFKNFVQIQGVRFLAVECGKKEPERPQGDFECLLSELRAIARLNEDTLGGMARAEALPRLPDGAIQLTKEVRAVLKDLALTTLLWGKCMPLVLHFHDLHRADRLVAYFLSALIVSLSEAESSSHLLLTGTSLDRGESEGSELHRLFQVPAFRNGTLDLSLKRVSGEGVSQLLGAMFGGTIFPDRFLRTVLEESDGNPEIVEEICTFFLDRGILQRTITGWTLTGEFECEEVPGRVRRELKEKITHLPPDALRLATAFACLGNSTELDLATRLAGTPREQILESMKRLHDQRILEEDTRDDKLNVYSFVHSTAQAILYQLLAPAERLDLHNRASVHCSEYYRAQGKESPKKLAIHFLRGGNTAQGIQHGIDAAKVLAEECQPQKALEMYQEVLGLESGLDSALRDRVRYEIAGLHYKMGEYRQALDLLILLSTTRARDGKIPSPTQVLVDMAKSHTRLGEFRQANLNLEKAMALEKEQLISVWMVHILVGYADLYFSMGRHEESLHYCEQVLKSRDQIHDVRLLTRLYLILAENNFLVEKKEIAARYCQDWLRVTDTKGDVELIDFSLHCMGRFYKYKGRFDKALKQFQLCSSLRKRQGLTDGQAEMHLEMGGIQLFLQRPRAAIRHLRESRAGHEKSGNLVGVVETLNLLSEAHRLLGEYEDSKKALNEALRQGKVVGNPRLAGESFVLGTEICLDRGDFESAERYLVEVEALARSNPVRGLSSADLRSRFSFFKGDFASALEFVEQGLEASKTLGNRLRAPPFLETQVLLQIRLGVFPAAQRTVGTLLDLARRHRLRLREGRGILNQGTLLAREGNKEGADASFNKALEIFKDEESERDLVLIYLEFGLALLERGQVEQAILYFEEGLYLAKKLNLLYWKCRLHFATGILESKILQGDLAKAEESLRLAERFARQAGFLDLLWQVEYELGRLFAKTSRQSDAAQCFSSAVGDRRAVLQRIPDVYRESYLAASPGRDLEHAAEESRARNRKASF